MGKARISRRLHLKNGLIVFPKQYSADGRIESVLQPSLSPPAVPCLLLPSFGSRYELPAGNQLAGATGGGGEHWRSPLSLKSHTAFRKEVCQRMPWWDAPSGQLPITATCSSQWWQPGDVQSQLVAARERQGPPRYPGDVAVIGSWGHNTSRSLALSPGNRGAARFLGS